MEIDVKGCSACGIDHQAMQFELLEEAVSISGAAYPYEGTCPETGIKVYLRIIDNEEETSVRNK